MRFLIVVAILCVPAFADFAALQKRAVKEGWTFTIKKYRTPHSTGLLKKDLPNAKTFRPRLRGVAIPQRIDLRPLTRIEDQDGLGSCWAFSLIANLRDGLFLLGRDPGRLSQEYLTQCSGYCNGGYFDAADYFIEPKGAPLWDEVPYTARCTPPCRKGTPVASIKSWAFLGKNRRATTRDIVEYIAMYHLPVSITVSASGAWGSYHSGIYNACNTRSTNHMINIVGYDLEGQAFDNNGWLPPGKGIWILRNSWGSGWGEKGFMRSRITGSGGALCNSVAERAVVYDFGQAPEPGVCGNGKLEPGEECDDGNVIDGDGCDHNCKYEHTCGNGILEPGEQCDDGNLVNGDGCDDQCRIEPPPPPPGPGPIIRFLLWLWNIILTVFDWFWPF